MSQQGHMAQLQRLETEKRLCAFPVDGTGNHKHHMHTKQTECDSSPQESRNGCRKLLFGDGTVEDTLDGGPSVSDSYWWVVSISQQDS